MSISSPKSIPSSPGVYIFRRGKTPLYIGKAANLKKRLISYFRKNTSAKIKQLVKETTKLEWREVSSEIEALIKEAELIKKHLPKYNILLRDDKNYFYVGITKERFPRIFITHQPRELKAKSYKSRWAVGIPTSLSKRFNGASGLTANFIGPFTNGSALKGTLRVLRRIFSYCTCSHPHKRPCLASQIGRCPGYCCTITANSKSPIANHAEYAKNIKNIVAVLNGKKRKLLSRLRKEMKQAAQKQEFEKAAKLRDQVEGLKNIFSHQQTLTNTLETRKIFNWNKVENNIRNLLKTKNKISRVEGYDISNISGTEATGSLVVFRDGMPAKSEYRKFRIKTVRQISDVDMLKEVLKRRLNHSEWSRPDLMLIDGGKPQLNAAMAALRNFQFPISNFQKPTVVALAKREEELYLENGREPVKLKNLPPDTAFFFQRVRDEAHRFARKYHHQLREKYFKLN